MALCHCAFSIRNLCYTKTYFKTRHSFWATGQFVSYVNNAVTGYVAMFWPSELKRIHRFRQKCNFLINVVIISLGKVKVNCTLVQALRLCTGRTAHRGSTGIALLFLDHGTRRGWGVSVTTRPLFTPGKDPVPNVQETGWASGPVWTSAENLAPTEIRSPDRPARSQ